MMFCHYKRESSLKKKKKSAIVGREIRISTRQQKLSILNETNEQPKQVTNGTIVMEF